MSAQTYPTNFNCKTIDTVYEKQPTLLKLLRLVCTAYDATQDGSICLNEGLTG